MALSTAIKNKMLGVRDLVYHSTLEIKNDSGSWVDFTDRDPVIGNVRLSTERIPNKIVSSVSAIVVENADRYFDYMDNPSDSTTTSLFGTKATGFASGFPGREVRLGLKIVLDDGTYEDAYLGIFQIGENIETDIESGKAKIPLRPDIWRLKEAGTDTLSDGERHYENRPISYLVREILKKVYPSGVGSSFEIPGKIYLPTQNEKPVFSHYGKPPERDDTGRWRTDIDEKPGPIYYHPDNGKFYVGVGDFVWEWDPDEEEWDISGGFDNMVVKGIYRMTDVRLLVVGWNQDFGSRGLTMRTGLLLTGSNALTTNDPGYDSLIFSGELVLRDCRPTPTPPGGRGNFGRDDDSPHVSGGLGFAYGRNMPVPFAQCARLALDNGTNWQDWGFPASTITGPISSGDWISHNPSDDPHAETFLEAGYWAAAIDSPAAGEYSGILAYWGHKANLAYASATNNFNGPYLFVPETDGGQMGIRQVGTIDIICYSVYDGTHSTITTASLTGADAPIYDLRYYSNQGTHDELFWISVDWIENFVNLGATGVEADMLPADWHIKRGRLSDDGGGEPELDVSADILNLWTSGDDLFSGDDSEVAPITFIPYDYLSGTRYIAQIFETDQIGNACYKLYYVGAYPISEAVQLGTAKYFGWGNFVVDPGKAIYAAERDTGRIIKIDITSVPSDYEYLQGGDEPVPGAYFECPNPEGLVLTTEGTETCLWGISNPYLPIFTSEDQVAYNGKYYLWKYHIEITDRVPLFEEDKYNAFDALGLLAHVVNYQVGIDPDGTGFFRPIPTSGSSAFTIDTEAAISRYFGIKKYDGTKSIKNRSTFIPYEALAREAEGSLLLNGYTDGGDRYTFNGEMEVRSETSVEKNITLHCIAAGGIGTADFRYIVHKYQVLTAIMTDVNPGVLDEMEVDNLNDVSAGMLVQVGDFEGVDSADPLAIDSIAPDGTITLSEDLDSAYPVGTVVIFRDAKYGKWSDEYASPDTFTTSTSWAEIGSEGVFLKFTADATPRDFAVGDRLEIYNPGMQLELSRTKKYLNEDTDSIDDYGLREFNIDNPFMGISLGQERGRIKVASEAEPHHSYKIDCPLFLQAVPLALITLRSEALLPTATDYEEILYIQEVTHNVKSARTTILARGVSAYR